jgi:NAD(P)-dependent dehydrogenase (short-subunit alcohol dehydrogenase family)
MNNPICLVTGATNGIGLETARLLAARGASVVLVGRSRERCETVSHALNQQIGHGPVDYLVADLLSQAEIRQLAEIFKQRYDRLDVLINNAGAHFVKRQETVDGLENTFALNHLACFLLTGLLLDRLKASAPARIVNVASAAHVGIRLDFDDLQSTHDYADWPAYKRSKLANVLFTYELARRLNGTGVTANALHPGLVRSGFWAGDRFGLKQRLRYALRAISPAKAARYVVYLATSPEVEGVTGRYFDRGRLAESSPESYDEDAARRLWDVSAQLTQRG